MDTDVTTNSTRRLPSSLTNIPNIIIVSLYVPTHSYDDKDKEAAAGGEGNDSVNNVATHHSNVSQSI